MTVFDWAGRPGFDAWGNLSADLRTEILAAGSDGWQEVFHEIATYNEIWRPLRPVPNPSSPCSWGSMSEPTSR